MEALNGSGPTENGAALIGADLAPVYAGRLEIRPADHAALVDGRPLTLTVRELQLLTELAQNAERVMTREELYARVWHRSYQKSDRSVDVYVGRLRTKLGPGASRAPLHPHPHGHRVPILARGLTGPNPVAFTSFSQRGHRRVTRSCLSAASVRPSHQRDKGVTECQASGGS